MAIDLFAGISVRDFKAAVEWYERLLGSAPSFFPNDVEAVWQLAENRWLYVEHRPEHAGHALNTVIVDNLEARVAGMAQRGITPAKDETYDNGVRKVTYLDPEGNEIGFGGTPSPGDPPA